MSSHVNRQELTAAFKAVVAVASDILVFHSSLKSLGYMEGGAQAVIDSALDAVSPNGTIAVPTLWYSGKDPTQREECFDVHTSPAWNGAVAEAMRLAPRSIRSNHFSHSVNAIGAEAEELTRNHGGGKPSPSPWSETGFAECSPWSHFYERNALYAFLGCNMNSCTMKHWIESRYVAEQLASLPEHRRSAMRARLAHECRPSTWCFYDGRRMYPRLAELGLVKETKVGDATLFALRTRPMVEATLTILRNEPEQWFLPPFLEWLNDISSSIRADSCLLQP